MAKMSQQMAKEKETNEKIFMTTSAYTVDNVKLIRGEPVPVDKSMTRGMWQQSAPPQMLHYAHAYAQREVMVPPGFSGYPGGVAKTDSPLESSFPTQVFSPGQDRQPRMGAVSLENDAPGRMYPQGAPTTYPEARIYDARQHHTPTRGPICFTNSPANYKYLQQSDGDPSSTWLPHQSGVVPYDMSVAQNVPSQENSRNHATFRPQGGAPRGEVPDSDAVYPQYTHVYHENLAAGRNHPVPAATGFRRQSYSPMPVTPPLPHSISSPGPQSHSNAKSHTGTKMNRCETPTGSASAPTASNAVGNGNGQYSNYYPTINGAGGYSQISPNYHQMTHHAHNHRPVPTRDESHAHIYSHQPNPHHARCDFTQCARY
jgi:hypothetical protein